MNKILAQNGNLTVTRSPQGWGVLNPQPDPTDVFRYYEVQDGEYGNQDGAAWLLKEKREHEAGLWRTTYEWQRDLLPSPVRPGKSIWNLVDVGAGAGWFVHYWNNTPGDEWNRHGGNAWGIEPSATCRRFGPCQNQLFESKVEWLESRSEPLDCPREHLPKLAVRFSLVLEHVPDPVGFVREHLDWPGLDVQKVMVIVPNEFNPLQKAALRRDPFGTFRDCPGDPVRHQRRAWFVDRRHLNYFDPVGLRALFRKAGLKIVFEGATCPMELFILAGLDYRKNPVLGRRLHAFRLRFEKRLGTLAFKIYKSLYDRRGIGRELVFVGELEN